MKKSGIMSAAVASAVMAITASQAHDEDLRIAYFASSSQNGYNIAVYEGMQARAAEIGGITTEMFDGAFDATVQYGQIEDVLTSGRFDGYVLFANDTVGVAGAVEQIIAEDKPIATVLFPIGPDLGTLDPQVDGLTATIGALPAAGARLQAEEVVKFCADKDPCRVVAIIGFMVSDFDQTRLAAYKEVFDAHDNIEIVATGEGFYSPDASLTVMQDVLQANPEFDVVITNADQQMMGVEIALESSGIAVKPLFLSGGGASILGVEAVREGRWDNTLAQFPYTMGVLALDAVIADLNGEEYPTAIDMDAEGPVPAILTKEVLDANPDFIGEWN